jgi:hypothetical protein
MGQQQLFMDSAANSYFEPNVTDAEHHAKVRFSKRAANSDYPVLVIQSHAAKVYLQSKNVD